MSLISADDSPRAAESVDVVLARMDGKLDRVYDRVNDIVPRVEKLESRTDTLESVTLVLTKNAEAEEAKKIALALALREADENRRNQSEQSWTPFQRGITLLGGVGVAAALAVQFYASTGGL